MIRRRRPRTEIEFSFDSFLDLVANVVGIIIRLILIAWVGARTYKAVVKPIPPLPPIPAVSEVEPLPEPTDERLPLLAARRAEIDQYRQNASAEIQKQQQILKAEQALLDDLRQVKKQRESLIRDQEQVGREASQKKATLSGAQLSLAELQSRSKALLAAIDRLRQEPVHRKELRYKTPVSAEVQTEEVMFECRRGRVTLIDTAALLDLIKRDSRQQAEALKSQWEVTPSTDAVGAFRLRYTLEREKSVLESAAGAGPTNGQFRYSITGWEVVPLREDRGERGEQALRPGSTFRKVIDALDAKQTVVTFWVYPDSFALFTQLRDALYERDVVVAGRPLPEGVPIASSRRGTISRGQ